MAHPPRHEDETSPGSWPPPAAPSVRAGDLLCDRFRVVRFIARGGMGELYEAEDLALHERVALKTIRPEIAGDERTNQRFRREVQLARKVTHPSICRIFDLFQHQPPGSPVPLVFVTMELLDGETLAARLERTGPMPAEEALPLVRQMAAALAAAHDAGVVHRDFKSSNVMLLAPRAAGEAPRVVVTDFGLAYHLGDVARPPGTRVSMAGELLGTPDYMAPEQLEGGAVTPATDVYAFGIVLYEMVTGSRPFVGETPLAAALMRLSGPAPRSARELVPALPPHWDRAIARCLARQPERRFSDAAAVAEALESGRQGDGALVSGRMALLLGAAVVVLALVGAGVWRSARETRAGQPTVAAGAAAAAPAAVAPRPSVAVLGFRNLAGRADVDWLSTALAEMLTTELGAGEVLRTVPGETVNRMKVELAIGDAESYGADTLARIRRNLGSELIVFGSFVAVGDARDADLRLDIRLQDGRRGDGLAVVSETGRADQLLDLISRAGSTLRSRIGLSGMAPADAAAVRASQSASPEVTRLYAQGLSRLRRFDALGARDLLERAVEGDPMFPLAQSALASAWAALGYDARARQAAERAFALSSRLSRRDRLVVEATFREMSSEWMQAVEIWQTLSTFFPDDVEYVIRLGTAQVAMGAPRDALATVERFRRDVPAARDPRLDLVESGAADTLADFKRAQAAAGRAARAAESQGARLLLAAARLREGGALLRQGDAAGAVRAFEQSRTLSNEAGDRGGVARALNNIANALSDGPEVDRAVSMYREGLGIAQAIGDRGLEARFLNNLAIQLRRAGDLAASLEMNQRALAIRREVGDRINTAVSLNNIGNVLLDLGDLKTASERYEESAALSREMGDRRNQARALYNAAEALRLLGELARARRTGEESLAIRRQIDDPGSLSTSLWGLGTVMALQGDLVAADKLLGEALAMERRLNRQRPLAYVLYELGELAFVRGALADATRLHREALDMRVRLGEKGTAAESQTALAAIALEEGRAGEAAPLARTAADVFAGQKAGGNEATARALLALALDAAGQPAEAARQMTRARALAGAQQNVLAQLPVRIWAGRLQYRSDPAAGRAALESARAEAEARGLVRYVFEAQRALAVATGEGSRQAALARDARARGFGLYAATPRLAGAAPSTR